MVRRPALEHGTGPCLGAGVSSILGSLEEGRLRQGSSGQAPTHSRVVHALLGQVPAATAPPEKQELGQVTSPLCASVSSSEKEDCDSTRLLGLLSAVPELRLTVRGIGG